MVERIAGMAGRAHHAGIFFAVAWLVDKRREGRIDGAHVGEWIRDDRDRQHGRRRVVAVGRPGADEAGIP